MEELFVSPHGQNNEPSSSQTGGNKLNEEYKSNDTDHEDTGIKFQDWGFQVEKLFEVAHRFYKRNESKAFHPSFDIRNRMNALVLQAKYGNYDSGRAPDVGILDLIGKNRQYQWSLLKGMSKTEAMSKFICTLDEICPPFKAHAEAVKISSAIKLDQQSINNGTQQYGETENLCRLKNDEQLKAIHTSLCRQTYNQFKCYAEKQYPNDLSNQKHLISTLQEQYYQQYISQMNPRLSHETIGSNSSSSLPSPSASESTSISVTQTYESKVDNPEVSAANLNDSKHISNAVQVHVKDLRTEQEGVNPDLKQNQSLKQSSSNGEESVPTATRVKPNVNISPTPTSSMILQNNTIHRENGNRASELFEKEKKELHAGTDRAVPNIGTNQYESHKPMIRAKDIARFEPFPEPKPIMNNKPEHKSVAIDIYSVNNSNQNHTEPSTSLLSIPPLELPPIESYTDGTREPSRSSIIKTQEIQDKEITPGISSTEVGKQFDISNEERQRPTVDTWSCGSSSRSASPLQQTVNYEPLELATIWTKKGVNEFKDSLVDDKHGGAYIVKQGTLLTIQVPTYPDGKYIYWEFVTEDYDIGFGLDFVYETLLAKPLTMSIYEESDDDDDDEEELGQECKEDMDVEAVRKSNGYERDEELERKREEKAARIANTVTIVPTYRRDSHEEIFVGRHRYPGQGYYLLRFDNTYSVLRSKSLFFRICYFI